MWVGHVLDHVLDHMIIGLMITALHFNTFQNPTSNSLSIPFNVP